jgi:hypothetical protein
MTNDALKNDLLFQFAAISAASQSFHTGSYFTFAIWSIVAPAENTLDASNPNRKPSRAGTHFAARPNKQKKTYATFGLFILKSRIVLMTGNTLDEYNYASNDKP